MKILITGVCGFAGSWLAAALAERFENVRIVGLDNLSRAGGGAANSMSIAQLASWCDDRFGKNRPEADTASRPFDIPWMVMDSHRAADDFGWAPRRSLGSILDEIAAHAVEHPEWSAVCGTT